jgi:hypothetical protein
MSVLVGELPRRRKIAATQPLRARAACRPDRPLEGRGRASPALGSSDRAVDAGPRRWRLCVDAGRQQQEAIDVLRYELNPQCCPKGIRAEDVQIFVEVA